MGEQAEELVRMDLPADLYSRLQQEAAQRGIPFDLLVIALLEQGFETKH